MKVDTPMHGSNLPLSKWFLAVHLMYTHPKGMSSVTMAKHLGVSQKTAWFLNHRIREAWRNPDDEIFDGPVEVDETFVGGKKKNMPRRKKMDMPKGHMPDNKTIVIGMKDRATKHVVAEVLPTRTAMLMQDFVYKHINRGDTTVYTDAHPAYSSLPNHDSVKHSQWGTGEYVRGEVYTNGIEGFWTLIKRGYMGVYHYMSKKHMPKYAVEYTERNSARADGLTTMDVLYQIVSRMVGRRLTFNQLRSTRIKTEDEICKEIFDRYRGFVCSKNQKTGMDVRRSRARASRAGNSKLIDLGNSPEIPYFRAKATAPIMSGSITQVSRAVKTIAPNVRVPMLPFLLFRGLASSGWEAGNFPAASVFSTILRYREQTGNPKLIDRIKMLLIRWAHSPTEGYLDVGS